MKNRIQNPISEEALQKLLEFEQLEMPTCSPHWEVELEKKLQESLLHSTHKPHNAVSFMTAILFFLNMSLLLWTFLLQQRPADSKATTYHVIANELLVPSNE